MTYTKKQYESALFDDWGYCASEFEDQIRQTVLDCLKKMKYKELKEVYETDKRVQIRNIDRYDKFGEEKMEEK